MTSQLNAFGSGESTSTTDQDQVMVMQRRCLWLPTLVSISSSSYLEERLHSRAFLFLSWCNISKLPLPLLPMIVALAHIPKTVCRHGALGNISAAAPGQADRLQVVVELASSVLDRMVALSSILLSALLFSFCSCSSVCQLLSYLIVVNVLF